jgi:hypothetical protein
LKLLARLGGDQNPERERRALRAVADDLGLEVVDYRVLQSLPDAVKRLAKGVDESLLLGHRAVPV